MKFSEFLKESTSVDIVNPRNLTIDQISEIFAASGYTDVELFDAKWNSFNKDSKEHVYNIFSEGGDDAPYVFSKIYIGLGENGWSAEFSGNPDQEFELADDAEEAWRKIGVTEEAEDDIDDNEEFPEI